MSVTSKAQVGSPVSGSPTDWPTRLDAIRAEEQRLAAHRRHLQATQPLNADDLHIVLHTWSAENRECHRCGGPYDRDNVQVHVVLGQESPSITTAICSICVQMSGEFGVALVALRSALEEMDSAFSLAPDNRLRQIATMASNGLALQADAYRAAEQSRYIRLHSVGGDL